MFGRAKANGWMDGWMTGPGHVNGVRADRSRRTEREWWNANGSVFTRVRVSVCLVCVKGQNRLPRELDRNEMLDICTQNNVWNGFYHVAHAFHCRFSIIEFVLDDTMSWARCCLFNWGFALLLCFCTDLANGEWQNVELAFEYICQYIRLLPLSRLIPICYSEKDKNKFYVCDFIH